MIKKDALKCPQTGFCDIGKVIIPQELRIFRPRGFFSRIYKTQMPIKEMGIFWSVLIVPNASQSFSRWAEYYLPLSFV
jgi:hypothetical protein